MKNNPTLRLVFDVLTFLLVFLAIQSIVLLVAQPIQAYVAGVSCAEVSAGLLKGQYGMMNAVSMLVSSVLTLFIYTRARWATLSRRWLDTHQWGVLCWTVTLALGTILPLEWLYEQLQIAVPANYQQLFDGIMREPLGYVAVGLLVPLAEELVFRGAVLRVLLAFFERRPWVAIAISAALFGVVHGNLAQGVHAFLIGLLLGWLYHRSGSIAPGVVFHWVNNSVAYILATLVPQMGDGQLIDFFHGSERVMWLGLLCSLCVFLPSLYQLAGRIRKA